MTRDNDTKIVLNLIGDTPITSLEIAEKTGFSAGTVGALLRNAKKKGIVKLVGERPAKRSGHWQMISVWIKSPEVKALRPITGIDQADKDWMAYWNNRRLQRLQRKNLSDQHD